MGRVYEVKEACDHKQSVRGIEGDSGTVIDLNSGTVTWMDNLGKVPSITWEKSPLTCLKKCNWTAERMFKYRDDGFLMFIDQHVEYVKYGEIKDHGQYFYLKGSVKPEQCQTAQRYET